MDMQVEPQTLEQLSLLVVDDDPSHRNLAREIFSDQAFRVLGVANGREALARLEQEDFDVVLLDKALPEINGDQVCHEIRQNLQLPFIPIIMVTAHGAYDELAKSLEAGATDFVRKPYHPLELQSRVLSAVRQKRLTDQLDHAETILFALARMVESKDSHTGQHCSRLVQNCHAFGKALGLGGKELRALRYGGVLHDIGKLAVPESILLKKAQLTDSEWRVIQQHPVIGAELCQGLNSVQDTVPIIRHHHERWDGSGYPDGLKGGDIPLLARVFQLVDIYDALHFERPYKTALPHEQVVEMIHEEAERGWRDPELTRAFLMFVNGNRDSLDLRIESEWNLGNDIFKKIHATGVLDWNDN